MTSALVTGITGQDGAYLARLLLRKGYEVHGAYRRTSSVDFWRLEELGVADHPRLHLVEHDLTDPSVNMRLLERTRVDEIYNLGAQSFVGVSFDQPVVTAQATGIGPVHLLEAIRTVDPGIRFYQASTSELYGKAQEIPQTETTPFYPRSPYGAAKLYAHWMTVNYREAHGLFAVSGILFNHESPLRGREFVTRRITVAVARIAAGLQERLDLGNLDARRDWGYAEEYVEGMWRMMRADRPGTYVLATGRAATVRDFVTMAFAAAGTRIVWQGSGADETGTDAATGRTLVAVDPRLYRPAEVDHLVGDASKARRELGWEAGTPLEALCVMMVRADMRRLGRDPAGEPAAKG